MNKDKEYPGVGFNTWSCTKCGELFRTEIKPDNEGPKACPICAQTDYSGNSFEKIIEEKHTREKQEDLEKLKKHLQKAVYRSRKI